VGHEKNELRNRRRTWVAGVVKKLRTQVDQNCRFDLMFLAGVWTPLVLVLVLVMSSFELSDPTVNELLLPSQFQAVHRQMLVLMLLNSYFPSLIWTCLIVSDSPAFWSLHYRFRTLIATITDLYSFVM
jgi:predicted small integral membrane protein